MFLKSIKLHNIRSYENAEIEFPLGSVLLAGDIGSGKSSVLLAIEFAIFGAKKGELPAYTLLRHGKKEGYAELRMQIDSKDILIKRILKRSNEDIRQEAGYIIINGIKKEGTSDELRAIVLELLGYPKDLIKKGKDMIYRYTVYTPQEDMKRILYEDKEARLETLRKVFNIDKYKRIRDNSRIIAASLREKKRHYEGFILDFEYKKKELDSRKNDAIELDKMIAKITPKLNELKAMLNEKRKSIENIEAYIKELNAIKNELSIAETSLAHKIEQSNRLNDEIKKLDRQLEELKKGLENRNSGELEAIIRGIIKKIGEKEKEINEADAEYKDSIRKVKGLEIKLEQCAETIKKVSALDICPLCEQKVDDGHKHDINSRESKKYDELLKQIKAYKEEESKLDKMKIELKRELDSLMKEQNYFNILKIKFGNLNEKINAKEERSNLKERVKKEIGALNAKKSELDSKANKYSASEEKYKIVRKEIDELLPQERFLELEKRKYETQKESLKKLIEKIETEVNEKQKAKEKLAHIAQINNWIEEFFARLMSTMEKHVMASIHSRFNELFKNWFDILLEDESISVRVDEEFTPIIEQDGYETYIENLSGGEKTSTALSYRLALNKVINDITAGIKTKDIIMLDEPTDGFSAEQLDKVRDVLAQLNMNQVIIVSHEAKIESFVEEVIRVNKQDGMSIVN